MSTETARERAAVAKAQAARQSLARVLPAVGALKALAEADAALRSHDGPRTGREHAAKVEELRLAYEAALKAGNRLNKETVDVAG